MKQKISVALSAIACVVILAVLLGMGYREATVKAVSGEPAGDYGQLKLYIQYSSKYSKMEKINIWKSEADCYYFFLPSCVVNSRLFFGNLQENDRIVLGESSYSRRDDISKELEYNATYEMQLNVNGELLLAKQVVFVCSENIPAVFVNTQTGTVDQIHSDKEMKEPAEASIVNQDGSLEFSGAIEYIKTRGNSTFYEVEKKSYQIKLHNKKNLFEMGSAKKWILLANAKDESLVRTSLILDFVSQHTEVASVEGIFVDVYLNGEYAGNYYLCEKVEVAESRLNITDLDEENKKVNSEDALKSGEQYVSEDGTVRAVSGVKNPEDITGGYLLEKIIEDEYDQARSAFISSQGHCYRVVSPENASLEQVEYIRNFINEMEGAIYQQDGINPQTGKHFSEYMDVDSWVSKYLIEEFFNNPDAPAASTYLYKDSDEVDSKIYFGPAWDYDRAIGGYVVDIFFIDDPRQIGYRGMYASRLLQFKEMKAAVKSQFVECFLPYLEQEAEEEIKLMQKSVEASAQMDRIRWPHAKGYYKSWDAAGEYLMNFLEERAEYLRGVWMEETQYHTVSFLDYYGNTYNKYVIKHGEYLTEIPSIATYVAVFNGWQNVATGKKLDVRLPILENATYQSTWIEAEYLVQNGLALAEANIIDVDVDALEAFLEAVKQMQEAVGVEAEAEENAETAVEMNVEEAVDE